MNPPAANVTALLVETAAAAKARSATDRAVALLAASLEAGVAPLGLVRVTGAAKTKKALGAFYDAFVRRQEKERAGLERDVAEGWPVEDRSAKNQPVPPTPGAEQEGAAVGAAPTPQAEPEHEPASA